MSSVAIDRLLAHRNELFIRAPQRPFRSGFYSRPSMARGARVRLQTALRILFNHHGLPGHNEAFLLALARKKYFLAHNNTFYFSPPHDVMNSREERSDYTR